MKRHACALTVIGLLLGGGADAAAQSPVAPPQAPAVLDPSTPRVVLAAGEVRHTLDIGAQAVVALESPAVSCAGATPAGCSAPPVIGGFADGSTSWSATRLEGRVLLVRNDGPGVLTLRAQDSEASGDWRLAQPRLLSAGEVVTLVYDATARVWRAVGRAAAGSGGGDR